MSVRAKINLLIAVFTALFLVVLGAVGYGQNARNRAYAETLQAAQARFFGHLLTLKGTSLHAISIDYTYWDEMVSFVRTGNREWAHQNLDTALSTFDVDVMWVYRTDFSRVYAVAGSQYSALSAAAPPAGALQLLRTHGPFSHFFMPSPFGLVEIRGATIQPTNDPERRTPARGYMLVGRVWDHPYVKDLSDMMNGAVRLVPAQPDGRSPLRPAPWTLIRVSETLNAWNGAPLVVAESEQVPNRFVQFQRQERQQFLLLGLFGFGTIGLVTLALRDWVNVPLGLISATLRTGDPGGLDRLAGDRAEFGRVADLMRKFFAQSALLAEITKRRHVEQQLRASEERFREDLLLAYDTTLEGWSRALEMRDEETEGHTRRVAELTVRLAKALGVADEELVHIRRGALLHDIGKMAVPDAILRKPGPLTGDEQTMMRRHPTYAHALLAPITYLRRSLDIPYCHHELWDGSGYPRGLEGERIPLAARIFTVADVWDALRSNRPYRPAWSVEQARTYLRDNAGTKFDSKVVAAFLRLDDV